MNVYLAGQNGRKKMLIDIIFSEEQMQVYLAGQYPWKKDEIYDKVIRDKPKSDIAILESFYYADEWTEKAIPKLKHFMLDSGAFTFMSGTHKGGKIVWEDYVDKYADFINRNKVDLFFELDIDSVVGYERVLELRKRLADKTGKMPIPVWHKSRGKENFLQMCKEYPYIAIGGIVTKEIKPEHYKFFPYFIDIAHKNGAKIHGLGFTNLPLLPLYHFDSVDSTSWTSGNRFGQVYFFDGKTIQVRRKPAGMKLADSKKVAVHNFTEWVKFQKYARNNL